MIRGLLRFESRIVPSRYSSCRSSAERYYIFRRGISPSRFHEYIRRERKTLAASSAVDVARVSRFPEESSDRGLGDTRTMIRARPTRQCQVLSEVSLLFYFESRRVYRRGEVVAREMGELGGCPCELRALQIGLNRSVL